MFPLLHERFQQPMWLPTSAAARLRDVPMVPARVRVVRVGAILDLEAGWLVTVARRLGFR